MNYELTRSERIFLESLAVSRGAVAFREVVRMFRMAGYEVGRVRGSHHSFVSPIKGMPTFTMPVHAGKVKSFYVRSALKVLFPEL